MQIKPNKTLGQNFLTNKKIVQRILKTADLKPSDTVLEIGPGLGALTFDLAKQVKKVIAVEKDRGLAQALQKELQTRKITNISISEGDALNYNFNYELFTKNYKLVANLPYNIATKIIMNFLEAKNPPKQMVVMAQKEVAQRICAAPPQMSKLAVFCQLYSKPTICFYVAKGNFFPKPKVDSAVMKFEKIRLPKIDLQVFAKIVNSGFASPRKTLLNNLSKGIAISKEKTASLLRQNGLSPAQRPQELSVDDWLRLTKTFK